MALHRLGCLSGSCFCGGAFRYAFTVVSVYVTLGFALGFAVGVLG